MRVQINHPINYDSKITTIKDLDRIGMIEYHKVTGDGRKINGCRKTVTRYFADIKGTMTGWEITQIAYLSRTNQKVEL